VPVGTHWLRDRFVVGRRHFTAVVVDATSAIVYVDGAPLTTVSANTPPAIAPTPLHLGCHNDDTHYGTKRFFAGTIRDARIYRRLLDAAEIHRLFVNGPATSPS
jgi:hypothetical protein